MHSKTKACIAKACVTCALLDILCSVEQYVHNDISGQLISPSFKSKEIQNKEKSRMEVDTFFFFLELHM
jgi:hypothetical protein